MGGSAGKIWRGPFGELGTLKSRRRSFGAVTTRPEWPLYQVGLNFGCELVLGLTHLVAAAIVIPTLAKRLPA